MPVELEILRQYADVLRVGRVKLNGEIISWACGGTPQQKFVGFCDAFFAGLRRLSELASIEDAVLQRTAYWFCKVVSINYVFADVLRLVEQKVGVVCSIETSSAGGEGLAEYNAEVRQTTSAGPSLCVGIDWKGLDNIVYLHPATAEREVKGTLTRLETEFTLPPKSGFMPTYSLQMSLRHGATRIMSQAARYDRRARLAESFHQDGPVLLQLSLPLEGHPEEEPASRMATSASSPNLAVAADSQMSTSASSPTLATAAPAVGLGCKTAAGRYPAAIAGVPRPSLAAALRARGGGGGVRRATAPCPPTQPPPRAAPSRGSALAAALRARGGGSTCGEMPKPPRPPAPPLDVMSSDN